MFETKETLSKSFGNGPRATSTTKPLDNNKLSSVKILKIGEI